MKKVHGHRALPEALVLAMWRDYEAGMGVGAVGRKHGGRAGATVRDGVFPGGYRAGDSAQW